VPDLLAAAGKSAINVAAIRTELGLPSDLDSVDGLAAANAEGAGAS